MAIDLPQEIVDCIVDHIASERNDGATSLRTCSVLSKAFSTPSRRYLFSKVQISSGPASCNHSARLLAILKRRFSPLEFIKSLTVEVEFEGGKLPKILRTNASNSGLYNAISRLRLRENPFLGVLKLLSQANLENLTIKTLGFLDWRALNRETLSAFTLLRSNPSLKSLHIHAVKNLDTSFLAGNGMQNQIEQLELSTVIFAPLETKTFGEDSSPSPRLPFLNLGPLLAHIKSFEIPSTILTVPAPPYYSPPPSPSPGGPPRQPATAPFKMSSLKRFVISYWEVQTEIEMLWKLMLSASQSLEYLEMQGVENSGSRTTFPVPIQLHRLSVLRSLKIVAYQIGRREGGTQQLIPITRLLKTATSPSSLETITIALSWNVYSLDGAKRLIYPGNGWLALDEALASPCFPSLKTVRVELELVFNDRFSEVEPRPEERAWAERVKDTHFKEMLPNISFSTWVRLDVEVDLDFVYGSVLLS